MCILAGWKDRQREAGWFVCNITRRPSSPLCAMWTFQIYITENTTIEVQILKNNSLKREINGVDFLFLISFLIFAQRTTPRAKRWVFKTQLMSLAQPVQWVQGFVRPGSLPGLYTIQKEWQCWWFFSLLCLHGMDAGFPARFVLNISQDDTPGMFEATAHPVIGPKIEDKLVKVQLPSRRTAGIEPLNKQQRINIKSTRLNSSSASWVFLSLMNIHLANSESILSCPQFKRTCVNIRNHFHKFISGWCLFLMVGRAVWDSCSLH